MQAIMEQRAKEMGKKAEAAVYRKYIRVMKKKTKEMQKEEALILGYEKYKEVGGFMIRHI